MAFKPSWLASFLNPAKPSWKSVVHMATDFAGGAAIGSSGLDENAGDGVGAMLKRRRIELEMSQADVANALKVVVRRIDAMEAERWNELPTGTFLRGFVRNYARALKIDVNALIERIDASLMRSRNPDSILVAPETLKTTLPRRSGPAEDHHTGRRLIYGAFVFALVAAVIAWSGTNSFDRAADAVHAWFAPATNKGASAPAVPAAPPSQTVSNLSVAGGAVDTPHAPVERSAPEAAPPLASDDARGSTAPAANGAAAANAYYPSAALTLHFDDAAWVEVRAADGKVLLSRLNAAGSEQSLAGLAPFELVIGNAPGVVLRYRGEIVDLAPYTRERVARLTLS